MGRVIRGVGTEDGLGLSRIGVGKGRGTVDGRFFFWEVGYSNGILKDKTTISLTIFHAHITVPISCL